MSHIIKQKKLVFGEKVCVFGSIHPADESEFPLLGTSKDFLVLSLKCGPGILNKNLNFI